MTDQATVIKASATDELYRKVATKLWSNDDLEIDDDARISKGEGGAWIHAWVWVSDDDIEGASQ